MRRQRGEALPSVFPQARYGHRPRCSPHRGGADFCTARWHTRHGSGRGDRELLTPCSRMVQLLNNPQDVPFFCKLLQREIIYRLLQGPQGGRLRLVATKEDRSYLTAKAVTWLRENFEKTLNVDELASMAGMSRSTLHHHFRGLTAMSPLQFKNSFGFVQHGRRCLSRNSMLRVQPSRWDTKVQASSIGSTSAFSENHRCAMYKHCGRPCDRRLRHPEWIVRNPETAGRQIAITLIMRMLR